MHPLETAAQQGRENQVFAVLPLVLQHGVQRGDDETDPHQLLCALLQVSRSVRAPIQQHGSMECAVTVPVVWDVTKWAQLARWLPRNAGHMRSLHVREAGYAETQAGNYQNRDMSEQFVSLGLQVCALSSAQPAAGAAGAHAAQQLAAAPVLPLQLQQLSWSAMQGPAVLQVLQGTVSSLTQLVLTDLQLPNAPRILATLGSFASLQSLTVECAGRSGLCALPDPFVTAVARLTRHTSLTGQSLACSPSPLYLPVSLVELHAAIECCAQDTPLRDGRVPFVLSHLANFVHFDARWFVALGGAGIAQLALPPQLTRFHQNRSRVEGLLPGGLRHFHVTDSGRCPVLIQQLRDLPDLTMLEVDVTTYKRGTDLDLAPLLAVLPACTRLTGLCVRDIVPGRDEDLVGLHWGRAVGRLTSLQQVGFNSVEFSPEDALHLSSLTALTALKLFRAAGVDDTALCALAVRLTNLVSLKVVDCGLSSSAPLPVVATLTKLRDLALTGKWGSALSNMGLTLLSTLTGLTRLQLPHPHGMTRSGIHNFVQRMPHLDRVSL